MKTRFFLFSLIVFCIFFCVSCLTVEKKEYTFEFTGKNSGKLTIRYINIMSTMNDTIDESSNDFNDLLTRFVNGDEIERGYPLATNVKKRLYEQDGKLCGEIIMEFPNLDAVHLFQYDKKSPLMCFLGTSSFNSETFESTNGTYGGEFMPVVFWPNKEKLLLVNTKMTEPSASTISLLPLYNQYNAK